jgi:glycosyltransferase involved in cell wall biosynthesis
VKLAIVVQRYGADINGGAELHARYVAELLARRHTVEVLTTCAHDYVTWRAHYPVGPETVNGVTVRRFPVARERDPEDFGRRSTLVFDRMHSVADELAWLESEGPTSPALVDEIAARADEFDWFLFFSYRYYHAWHGIRRVARKAILVPTAERDAALGLSIFGSIFRGVRALMYNSHEERALIQALSGNTSVPGVVVGVGSEVPRETSPERFRRKHRLDHPFVVYVGRIDENKGCRELFDFFVNYRPRLGQRLSLVLMGNSILPIPRHPAIRHLGFVPDRDKFDGIAASDALIMPSFFESLSMVAVEAWALGRPVLANGRCDVLRGQCIRSRAGLYYDTFEEFAETLFTLTMNRPLNAALGENGRHFFARHYAWPVIERKYTDMLNRLAAEGAAGPSTIEPLPGWIARRRHTQSPASAVVDALPRGPVVVDADADAGGPEAAAGPARAAAPAGSLGSPGTARSAAAVAPTTAREGIGRPAMSAAPGGQRPPARGRDNRPRHIRGRRPPRR